MPRIDLGGISRTYPGGTPALKGIDLAIGDGELLAVLGPSGSGKSTLLRLIAGLEVPSAGILRLEGRDASGLAPRARDVAMVFQNQAPLPHLNVFDNLAFGARARGVSNAEIERRIADAAGLLGIAGHLGRMPGTMSGGERQRVALGRAIVRRPSILLLDEPFSNLDAPLRLALRTRLVAAHHAMGTTTVLVTHDQQEAVAVGDRVAVLEQGRLRQVGLAEELLDRPACRFVAGFLGDPPMGTMPVEVGEEAGVWRLRLLGEGVDASFAIDERTQCGQRLRNLGPGRFRVGLRMEGVHAEPAPAADLPILRGPVAAVERRGRDRIARIGAADDGFWVRLPPGTSPEVGSPLRIGLDLDSACWFDAATSARIDT